MAQRRPSGIEVEISDDLEIGEAAGGPRRRARGRSPRPKRTANAVLADFFSGDPDMELVDELELLPRVRKGRQRSRRSAPRVDIEVPLEQQQQAIILVEQDGVLQWKLPKGAQVGVEPTSDGRRRRTRGAGRANRTAKFSIRLGIGRAPRRRRSGVAEDFVVSKARAYVVRFAARVAGRATVQLFERKSDRGLIQVSASAPDAWQPVRPEALELPPRRPARVLLLVHGTFSSTIGSYGALGTTPWGRAFLQAATERYDTILGFDHRTLSADPRENAVDLLSALESTFAKAPEIDIVSFSRGGLVVRSLLEHVLPTQSWRPNVGSVVFVGATNGGTVLADPASWQQFVDLYTTLGVAATRALQLIPQAAPAAIIAREVLSGTSAFVKALVSFAVEEGDVPGLAAMRPEGAFVREINRSQQGQPGPGEIPYYAVTSDFDVEAAAAGGGDLPASMLQRLADGLIDRLMGEPSDLVVHTESMTEIDPHVGGFIRGRLDFGPNSTVFHLNYFERPEVVEKLGEWLSVGGASTRRRGRRRRGGPRDSTGGYVQPATIASGSDLYVAPRGMTLGRLRSEAARTGARYLVLEREWRNRLLHYAVTPEEIDHATGPEDSEAIAAMSLREVDSSKSNPESRDLRFEQPETAAPASGRNVIFDDDTIVGVLPSSRELPSLRDLFSATAASSRGVDAEQTLTMKLEEDSPRPAARETGAPAKRRRTRRGARGVGGVRRSAAREVAADAEAAIPEPPVSEGAFSPSAPPPSPVPAAADGPGSPRGDTPSTASPLVECHFLAETGAELQLNKVERVDVTISRDEILEAVRAVAARVTATLDSERKVILDVIGRKNIRVVGDEDRIEIAIPDAGEEARYSFDVEPTELGEGEIWVQVRQGPAVLATMKLDTTIVERAEGAGRVEARSDITDAPPIHVLQNSLRIHEEEQAGKTRYVFELTLPEFDVQMRKEGDQLDAPREDYIADIYDRIEEHWDPTPDGIEAFQSELRAIGASLFDQLVPTEVKKELWDHRDEITEIQVFATEPFIPWELLYLKEPGARRAPTDSKFLGQMGLVRWIFDGFAPRGLRARDGHCRFVIPSYDPLHHEPLPSAEVEALYMKAKFAATPVTPNSLPVQKALREPGLDLIHFACHGEAESDRADSAELILEGKHDRQHGFIDEKLTATWVEQSADLRAEDGYRPVVVLNACQIGRSGPKLKGIGGFAHSFLRAGAGVFVGSFWSVEDATASVFATTLYDELLAGRTLGEAAVVAREFAKDEGDATWLAYTVYGDPLAKLTR